MNISHYFTSPQKAPAPRPVRLTPNTQQQLGFAGPRPISAHPAVVSVPVAKPAAPRAPRQPLLRRARLVVRVALCTAAVPAAVRHAHLPPTACRLARCRHRPAGTTHHGTARSKTTASPRTVGNFARPTGTGAATPLPHSSDTTVLKKESLVFMSQPYDDSMPPRTAGGNLGLTCSGHPVHQPHKTKVRQLLRLKRRRKRRHDSPAHAPV